MNWLRNWLRLALVIFFFAPALGNAQGEVPKNQEGEAIEKIPESARFDLDDIKAGEHLIVGRVSIRRQFLGTRATPAFQDIVQFHCFDGSELRFAKFAQPDVAERLAEQLGNGYQIPAMITIQGKYVRVGHDGINMSMRFIAEIVDCKTLTAETVTKAAKADFGKDATEKFEASLKPDAVSNGVAVSIEKFYVRSKEARSGSAVPISGPRVSNPHDKSATVKIKRVSIEQKGDDPKGDAQECKPSERSKGPVSWEIEAESWSDGAYEKGKMPKRLWMFQPTTPIEPKQKVTVNVEIELNGKPLTLTKVVDSK